MPDLPAKQPASRVAGFLEKIRRRGRLAFILDATASRQPTWDQASHLQAEMFQAAGQAGGLEIQLTYFRGDECSHSAWVADPQVLANSMRKIMCMSGHTQIGKALTHVRREHGAQPISAIILVGDACEEAHGSLFDAVAGLPPIFAFLEGHLDPGAEQVFRELARRTGGAFSHFDGNAAGRLAELLKAVAAFAAGGVKALEAQGTAAARLLLGQIKK